MTQETSRKEREFNRVPFDTFDSLSDKLKQNYVASNGAELTDAELARQLGYSSTVIFGWRAEGSAPKVAVLAAEALLRRLNPRNAELHPKILLLKFKDKDSFALFELMADKVKGMEILYASGDAE